MRPDLTRQEAWEVLKQVAENHHSDYGITRETITQAAKDLFGRTFRQ